MSARLATAAALLLASGGALALAAHGWGWAWTALILAALAAGLFEWAKLLGLGRAWCAAYAVPALLGVAAVLAASGTLPRPEPALDVLGNILGLLEFSLLLTPMYFWVAWLIMLLSGAFLFSRSPGCRRAARVFWGLAGWWIMPAAAIALAMMAADQVQPLFGAFLALSLLLVAAATDTAAFLAGRRFGRRLLAPRISPGKTWLGLGAGLAAAGAAGACLLLLSLALAAPHVHWPRAGLDGLLLGLATGMCVVAGDLAVSALKRSAGVKDSGRLLPGHGGVLDRIDGFLLAAPAFVFMLLADWPVDIHPLYIRFMEM